MLYVEKMESAFHKFDHKFIYLVELFASREALKCKMYRNIAHN